MIARMKKYAFLVFHKEYEEFLKDLGNLGILHVIEREDGERDDNLNQLESQLERTQEMLDVLKKAGEERPEADEAKPHGSSLYEILNETEGLEETIDILEHETEELRKERDRVLPWGDFKPSDLNSFTRAGYQPFFLKSSSHQFEPEWESRDNLFVVNRKDGSVYFLLLVPKGETPDINVEQEKSFDRSLGEIQKDLTDKENRREALQDQLAGLSRTVPQMVEEHVRRLESEISILHVYQDTQCASEETLRILEGWVPADSEKEVRQLADRRNVVYLETEPEEGETPPVQLKNGRFSRLFEPISNLFDLPSYREMDLTPYFAPFFMLFFGFCLGDAGYGVFFLIFASILKLKAKANY
jgi:V/A-type H+-transporting ATPase subunit I